MINVQKLLLARLLHFLQVQKSSNEEQGFIPSKEHIELISELKRLLTND